eukprot:COSAG06_NODE_308_length_17789_cov_16.732335_3_plen_84_part_00
MHLARPASAQQDLTRRTRGLRHHSFLRFPTRVVAESFEETPCVRRAQEARLQSLAMQLAESDCTLRVTNTHLCSADSARAKEK